MHLPFIRRLEAVAFRSWPSTTTHYDGTWAVRLTAGHPAKRLNSVNPMDPADNYQLEKRVERVAEKFRDFGRELIFRISPLAPLEITTILSDRGWVQFDETIVMTSTLDTLDLQAAVDRVPMKHFGPWIDQIIALNAYDPSLKPGLAEVITAIGFKAAPFMIEDDQHKPNAAALCVHCGDLAGMFEVISDPQKRGQGYGRAVVESALKWAKQKNAKTAFLQVTAENRPAISLYQSLGFGEVYRYTYFRAPVDM